jgi:hypothetical protein
MTAAWLRFTNWLASSAGPGTRLVGVLATYRRVAVLIYVPVVVAVFVVDWSMGSFVDAHAYYRAASDWAAMYAVHQADLPDSFMYSPVFAQLLGPLAATGWALFAAGWFALNAAALWWLAREWALLVLILPVLYPWSPPAFYLPVLTELRVGNVQLLLAAALALSLTRPVAFALPLLTKPTLGIGLIWYGVRREWRSLTIALGAACAVVLVSVVVDPAAWLAWRSVLLENVASAAPNDFDAPFQWLPLVVRLGAAAGLVAWGAWRDRPWTLIAGGMLASPVLWRTTPVFLLGLLPLLRARSAVPRTGPAIDSTIVLASHQGAAR